MQEFKSENVKLDSEFISKAIVKLLKQDIFNRYKQTGEVTDEDWEFCEKIDWHPVDELPPKKEHVEELKRILKEQSGKKYSSAKEFFSSLK